MNFLYTKYLSFSQKNQHKFDSISRKKTCSKLESLVRKGGPIQAGQQQTFESKVNVGKFIPGTWHTKT